MGRYSTDSGGGDFQQAPAGSHIARCIRLIDIGTHHGEYQGAPTVRNQVIVQWEIPGETIEIEGEKKPLIVSKFYTNSMSEKANLRKDIESWRASALTTEEAMKFDLMKILGVPAMLSIVHNEKGKAQVVGVSKLPKGVSCPPAYNDADAFWIDEWDEEKFEALSKGFKNLVMQSDEYKERVNPSKPARHETQHRETADELDSDIPFSPVEHDDLKNMLQVSIDQADDRILSAFGDGRRTPEQVQDLHKAGRWQASRGQPARRSAVRPTAGKVASSHRKGDRGSDALAQRASGSASGANAARQCRPAWRHRAVAGLCVAGVQLQTGSPSPRLLDAACRRMALSGASQTSARAR